MRVRGVSTIAAYCGGLERAAEIGAFHPATMRSSRRMKQKHRVIPQERRITRSFRVLQVPRTGFEPARVASLPPQSSASASSATWANLTGLLYRLDSGPVE